MVDVGRARKLSKRMRQLSRQNMYMTGELTRVVQETTRETLPPDFGRSESSLEHGLIDAVITRHELKTKLGQILRLCAGGTLVPMEPNGEAAPPPSMIARVLRFLRSSPHGDAHTNGGPA